MWAGAPGEPCSTACPEPPLGRCPRFPSYPSPPAFITKSTPFTPSPAPGPPHLHTCAANFCATSHCRSAHLPPVLNSSAVNNPPVPHPTPHPTPPYLCCQRLCHLKRASPPTPSLALTCLKHSLTTPPHLHTCAASACATSCGKPGLTPTFRPACIIHKHPLQFPHPPHIPTPPYLCSQRLCHFSRQARSHPSVSQGFNHHEHIGWPTARQARDLQRGGAGQKGREEHCELF